MRTYKDVVERAANAMWADYMGGGNEYYRHGSNDLVAYAYGVTEAAFLKAVKTRFEKISAEYYENGRLGK